MRIYLSNMKLYIWVIFMLLTQFMWTLIRNMYAVCQMVLWKVNGTSAKIKRNYDESAYAGSIQVLKVFWRYKFDPLGQPSGPNNFIASHERFEDPEYVLSDHVSLFYVNQSEAIWVEVDEEVDPTRCEYSGFFYFAQWKLAKRLIIMPIHVLHKLGHNLGKPNRKLIFMSNTARCGSTLLTRIFAETKQCLAFSEPDCLNAITMLRNVVSDAERDKIFTTCINLLCKPLNFKKIETYFIKLTQPTMVELPHIKRLFPESYHLFLYRDALSVVTSLTKFRSALPMGLIVETLGRLSSTFTKKMVEQLGLHADQFEVKLETKYHFGTIMWSAAIRQYLDLREQGFPISAARYEDIKINPNAAFQNIFRYFDLPFDAEAVENGMSKDSQRSSPLSMDIMKCIRAAEFTSEIKLMVDKISDQFKVPKLKEEFIAPGTITY